MIRTAARTGMQPAFICTKRRVSDKTGRSPKASNIRTRHRTKQYQRRHRSNRQSACAGWGVACLLYGFGLVRL